MSYRMIEDNPWKPGPKAWMEVLRTFAEARDDVSPPPPPTPLKRRFRPYLVWVNPRFKREGMWCA